MKPRWLRRYSPELPLVLLLAMLVGVYLMLASCTNLAKPETIRQKLAYAEASLTGTYVTIRDLRTANRITPEQRDELVRQADVAGASLDAARTALADGLPQDALARLEAARSVLLVVQGLLERYQQ